MPAPSRRSGVEAVAAGSKIGVAQSKSAGFSRKIRRQPGCNRSLRTTSTSQRAKTTLFRLSLALSVILTLAGATFAQQPSETEMLLDVGKPSVYIRYVESQKNPGEGNSDEAKIRLRLFNNTRDAISIPTTGFYLPPRSRPIALSDRWGRGVLAMSPGASVSPCYIVEAPATEHAVEDPETKSKSGAELHVYSQFEFPLYKRLQLGPYCHLRSISWIASGESVFFTVPREHLESNYLLSISFNYEWEKRTGDVGDVRNWVTFSGDEFWETIGSSVVQEQP